MLELMLAGNNVTVVPESGPGNKKLLKGDRSNGWFGIVPANEMPSPITITSGTGVTANMPQVGSVGLSWLKAVLNGKHVFLASTPFSTTLTLVALYNAGLVYGTDDNGTQVPTGATATNQFRLITFVDTANKTWMFKLRMINTVNPNTMTSNNTPPTASVWAGELWNLFSHVIASSTVVPTDGVKWDGLVPGRDFYNDRQYSNSIYGASVFQGAPTYTVGQYNWFNVATPVSWFPMLEVIDPDTSLIPPVEITLTVAPISGVSAVGVNDGVGLFAGQLNMVAGNELNPVLTNVALPTPLTTGQLLQVSNDELTPQSQLNG